MASNTAPGFLTDILRYDTDTWNTWSQTAVSSQLAFPPPPDLKVRSYLCNVNMMWQVLWNYQYNEIGCHCHFLWVCVDVHTAMLRGCGYGWRKKNKRNCKYMMGCKHQSTVQNSCPLKASHPGLLDMMFIQYSCLLPVKFLSLFWSVMLYRKEGGWWTSKDWCWGLYANLACCWEYRDLSKLMFDSLKQLNVNKENTSGSVSLLTFSIFNWDYNLPRCDQVF